MFKRFVNKYNHLLNTRPFITESIVSSALFGGGDLLCQLIQGSSADELDYKRTLCMAAYGSFFGPMSHFWYKMLDKHVRFVSKHANPSKYEVTKIKLKQVGVKILLDEAVYAPIVITTLFTSVSLMEGKTLSEAFEHLKKQFIKTYMTELMVWPPAQAINFYYLPSQYRVLFVNVISIFWNAFLSKMQHEEEEEEAAAQHKKLEHHTVGITTTNAAAISTATAATMKMEDVTAVATSATATATAQTKMAVTRTAATLIRADAHV